MKQETLEEAAENAFNDFKRENPIVPQKHIFPYKLGYVEGTKWQQERMYSEEEVLKLLITFSDDRTFLKKDVAIKWFEQFKNK